MNRRLFLKGLGFCVAGSVLPAGRLLAASEAERPEHVKDYLTKINNFNLHFADDIILRGPRLQLLHDVVKRLERLQRFVGYANFSLLNWNQARYYARNYSRIGAFTKSETRFVEEVFYTSASDYGFYGEKIITEIDEGIRRRDTVKIAGSGHYLFRGEAERIYAKIRKDVGNEVILTSGVRGLMKQLYLFLNKALESRGNLSMASRSLAPPGHSFHGRGDFDVGKRGFGYRNFTADFAETVEYKRLQDLGYINIRYHRENPFGVRFEPWHIKVV